MMKMDGRDSAECQNWKKRDKIGIFEIVKLEKDKNENGSHLLQIKKKKKTCWNRGVAAEMEKLRF